MRASLTLLGGILAIAGLASCSASADRPAATAARGEQLYEQRQCRACHDATEPPSAPPAPFHQIRDSGRPAQSHRFAGSRFQTGWIETFLMEPPVVGKGLAGIEALAIARFLETQKDTSLVPDAPGLEDARADTAAVAAGMALYEQFACVSCHRIDGRGETVGPDLTDVGRRLHPAYIAANLHNPQRLWPTSEMPNFGLTQAQIRSLVAYLSAQGP